MPKTQKPSGKSRHDPLHVQLDGDEIEAKYGRISQPGKRRKSRKSDQNEDDDLNAEAILDPKSSRRIFELARDQQDELESLESSSTNEDVTPASFLKPRTDGTNGADESDQEEEEEVEEVEEIEIDAEDMETLDALLPSNKGERKTLADIIFAKLDGGEDNEINNPAVIRKKQQNTQAPDPAFGLDPRTVEAFTKLGLFLQKYKSGPLPKLFKVLPTLPAWARMLALTHPENWSPHACSAATKSFISSMKPPQAQLFLQVVLLDAIREDIQVNKKLDYHYYQALKRAFYKPSAAFKGIIFPLLDNACTLKEAAIIASVIARIKLPVLHSSAAILRIAEMEYSGANSLFLRVLIDKKYELPFKVVDSLVEHFIRLSNEYRPRSRADPKKLPVLWHQSLLAFVQRYASDLTPEAKDALLDVVRVNPHPQISSEVRRELASSTVRGAPRLDVDNDVVMA